MSEHVGATLGKGLNRMIATCIAGYLGVSAHHLAELSGKTGEPILLGLFGFLVGKYIYTVIHSFISMLLTITGMFPYYK